MGREKAQASAGHVHSLNTPELIYMQPAGFALTEVERCNPGGGGGYSHTLPIRVCAAQMGRDFEAPGLERGIHFRRGF